MRVAYSHSRTFALSLALLALATSAFGQQVRTAVTPDTIRVGDPFRVLVRLEQIPSDVEIALPDSVLPGADYENASRARIERDSVPSGRRLTAIYTVTGWRPGTLELSPVEMIIRSAAGEQRVAVSLPNVEIVSVLPADTTNIEAKPPKDVLGASRLWWPWLLAALALLLLAALAYWLYRRRRKPEEIASAALTVTAREKLVAELDRLRGAGLIERREFKRYYTQLSEAVRVYLAASHEDWSTDLTTDELAQRLRTRADAAAIVQVLRHADLVKFARATPSADDALRDLNAAREWALSFHPVPEQDLGAAA